MRPARWLVLVILGAAVAAGVGMVWREQRMRAERDAALDAGDFAHAEPLLRAWLSHAPQDVEVLRALARGYAASRRRGPAEECLTGWLRQAPDDPEALALRFEVYRELADYDRALADLDHLLALDPGNASLRRKRPGILFSAGRFAEAEDDAAVYLHVHPGDRTILRLLAEAKRARGELAQAGAILGGLLREAPDDPPTLMARATLHFDQGEPDRAIPLYRKVLALDPNRQRTARYHLSLALARVGQTDEARRLMEEVRHMQDAELLRTESEGQPNNLPLQIRAARAQFENHDLARARAILDRVLRRDPDAAEAHALLADIDDRQGQFEQAAEHRRRARATP